MSLSFPPTPAVNDTYTSNGRTWRWDGTVWSLATPVAVSADNVSGLGTMATETAADYLTVANALSQYASGFFIPPAAFGAVTGSPTFGATPVNRKASWTLAHGSLRRLDTLVWVPAAWANIGIRLYWANGGGGAGDVSIDCQLGALSEGADVNLGLAGGAATRVTKAAGAQNIVVHSTYTQARPAGGDAFTMWVSRLASSPDTLANAVLFLGARLYPA